MRSAEQTISLVGSTGMALPPLQEQFVRGDQLHLWFPQCDDGFEFGAQVVIRPVEVDSLMSGAERMAFEFLVSIQTSRLDSHPTVDLCVSVSSTPSSAPLRDAGLPKQTGSLKESLGQVEWCRHGSGHAAVVLGESDAPFTSIVRQGSELRLRLFGDFLEKGVIRRARPWVLLDRADQEIPASAYRAALKGLADSPLPLD